MKYVGHVLLFTSLLSQRVWAQESEVPSRSRLDGTRSVAESVQRGRGTPNQMIKVSVRDSTISYILGEIVKQTNVKLLLDEGSPELSRRISVDVMTSSPIAVIDKVLANTGLESSIASDGTILVRKRTHTVKTPPQEKAGSLMGQVIDSATKKPLAGATVEVQRLNKRALTSDKGAFVVTGVPVGKHAINVRLFGYRSMSLPIEIHGEQEAKIQIMLAPVTTSLSEVVTTATGMQRRVEVGNDVTVIDVQQVIQKNPVSTVSDLLATRVPGVTVARASGEPGAKTEIRIRGTTSIRASMEPIVIIDGVQVIGDRAGADRTGFATSPIDQLDVNAISKVEVLKGPSAVALYGSNAANGVIVITTKRGQRGPARWNAVATARQTTMPGKWPVNYFAWGEDLTAGNGTVHCPRFAESKVSRTERLNWGVYPNCRYDSTTVYQSLNDPNTTVFGTGLQKNLSMTVDGGNQQITYSFTGTHGTELGLMKFPDADVRLLQDAGIALKGWQRRPQGLDQYSGTAALTFRIGDHSDLTYSTKVIREDKRSTPLANILGRSKDLPPPVILYDQNGVARGGGSGVLTSVPDFMAGQNSSELRFANAVNYRATFWNDLTVEGTVGIDASNARETYLLSTGDYCPLRGALNVAFGQCPIRNDSTATDYKSMRNSKTVTDAHLKVSGRARGFSWLTVTPIVGVDVNSVTTGISDVWAGRLPVGGRSIQGAGWSRIAVEGQSAQQTAGMFAQATVGIANEIWLPFSIRTDAGNAIGPNDKPIFPRLGFSYLVSDGAYFRSVPILGRLPELRLRTSFGVAGRQPGLTDKHRTYNFSRFPVENVDVAVVSVNSVGNTKLSPELSREWELGFDMMMVDRPRGRLEAKLTVAQTHTSNLLMIERLAPSLGEVQSRWSNIGDAMNQNIEAEINGSQRIGPLDWNTNIGLSTAKGRLVRLKNAIGTVSEGDGIYQARGLLREGYPIGAYWARPVFGYVDGDGDGQIQFNEVIYGSTLQYVGTPAPRFTLRSNNTITVAARLAITASLLYEGGNTANSEDVSEFSREMNDPTISLEEQLKLRYDALSYSHRVSTLKFQSVQMTYSMQLPKTARLLGARSLQVSVSGTNLGLWSTFSGLDPTVGGIDRIATRTVLPVPRSYGISMRVQ